MLMQSYCSARDSTRRNTSIIVAADAEVPAQRQAFLDGFPPIIVVPEIYEETATFTRPELSAKLGGGMQGVIGTCVCVFLPCKDY